MSHRPHGSFLFGGLTLAAIVCVAAAACPAAADDGAACTAGCSDACATAPCQPGPCQPGPWAGGYRGHCGRLHGRCGPRGCDPCAAPCPPQGCRPCCPPRCCPPRCCLPHCRLPHCCHPCGPCGLLGHLAAACGDKHDVYEKRYFLRSQGKSWHSAWYDPAEGRPIALVVPPTAEFQTQYGWGVPSSRVMPIYHQFRRPYPGPGAVAGGGGGFLPTPNQPSDTVQFGVNAVRGPWGAY